MIQDGDSLVYSMTPPRAATSLDPCPQAIPVTPAPHFTINAASGELATVPFGLNVGNYIMAVRVEEYRRIANRVDQNRERDARPDVPRCQIAPATATPRSSGLSVGSTPQALAQTIRVNPGQSVVLNLTATDQDGGQELRFSSEAATTIPGVTFQTVSATARLALRGKYRRTCP